MPQQVEVLEEEPQWRLLHGAICGEVRGELQRFAEDILQPKLSQLADRVRHDLRSELGSSCQRVSISESYHSHHSQKRRSSCDERDRDRPSLLLHTPIMAQRFDEDLVMSRRSSNKRRTAPGFFTNQVAVASLREAASHPHLESNDSCRPAAPMQPIADDDDESQVGQRSSMKSRLSLKTRSAMVSAMANRLDDDAGDLMGPKTSMKRRMSLRWCQEPIVSPPIVSAPIEPPPLPEPKPRLSRAGSDEDEEELPRTPDNLPMQVPPPLGEPPGLRGGPRKSRTMSTVFSADLDADDNRSTPGGRRRSPSISVGSTLLGDNVRRMDTIRTSVPTLRKGSGCPGLSCNCWDAALYYLSDFVISPWFERLGALAIFLNTIYIGIATEYVATLELPEAPVAFQVIEIVFLAIFFIEFALRVLVFGSDLFRLRTPEGLRNDQFLWNCLDCSIIVLQVVELLLGSAFAGLKVIRILRLMRLVRIVRLVKVMRFVADLRMIVSSIWRSISLFFWSLVALTMLNFICSVYFTEYVLTHKVENDEVDQDLDKYFGSLSLTMMSLFQAVTGGIDWGALTDVLKSETHYWVVFPFIMYVAFSQIAMLNVISGVFLETAMEIAREEKEIYVFRNARVVFDAVDHAHSGHVSWPDFEASLQHPHMQHFFEAVDIRPSEARTLFNLLDVSGDGLISSDEFLNGCLRVKGPAKALDLLILSREVSHLFEKHVEQRRALQENRDAIVEAMKALEDPAKDVEIVSQVLNTLENLTARSSILSFKSEDKDRERDSRDRDKDKPTPRMGRCPSLIESKQLVSPRWDAPRVSDCQGSESPSAASPHSEEPGRPDSRRGRCRTMPLKVAMPGFQDGGQSS